MVDHWAGNAVYNDGNRTAEVEVSTVESKIVPSEDVSVGWLHVLNHCSFVLPVLYGSCQCDSVEGVDVGNSRYGRRQVNTGTGTHRSKQRHFC